MLGITVPDAIAVGTLVAAVLAGWFGRKSGDALSKVKPIEPTTSGIAAGFVDKDRMERLVLATENIAFTLKKYLDIQTDEHENRVEDTLLRIQEAQDRLAAAVLKKNDDDDRAERSVKRTGDRVERTLDRTADRVTDRITGRKPPKDQY